MNRQIVLTRSGIASGVGLAAVLLARYGIAVDEVTRTHIVDGLDIALPVALPLLSGLWSRLHVTPVFDPKDASGRPLVPAIDADLFGVDPATLDTTATFPVAPDEPVTDPVPADPAAAAAPVDPNAAPAA